MELNQRRKHEAVEQRVRQLGPTLQQERLQRRETPKTCAGTNHNGAAKIIALIRHLMAPSETGGRMETKSRSGPQESEGTMRQVVPDDSNCHDVCCLLVDCLLESLLDIARVTKTIMNDLILGRLPQKRAIVHNRGNAVNVDGAES